MKNTIQDKTKLVNSVFSQVYEKYDLMNDIMSFGAHRIWKNKFLDWMNPQLNNTLIDVASGTGDIAKIFSKKVNNTCKISCVEPNNEMYNAGKNSLKNFKNIKWFKASAEKLPFKENSFDFYTISYGIRNVSNINLTLKEAKRVLKPGGRFMCLEFSKLENSNLAKIYDKYSQMIPKVGKLVVGDEAPYQYLVDTIEKFPSQQKFKEIIENNGFIDVEYRNIFNGIVAIHSAWKK